MFWFSFRCFSQLAPLPWSVVRQKHGRMVWWDKVAQLMAAGKQNAEETREKGLRSGPALQRHITVTCTHLLIAHPVMNSSADRYIHEVSVIVTQTPLWAPLLDTATLRIKPSLYESLGDTSYLNHHNYFISCLNMF